MTMKRHLLCLVATTAAACLLVTPAFAAKGINWNETFKNADGKVLNFRVTSLTIIQSGWSAKVSFTNLSKQTIQVGNEFGIAFFANSKTTDPMKASALSQATVFSPKRPTSLKPGATWSGTIGGSGQLETAKASGHLRILFGPFVGVPGQKAATSWITDHSTSIPATVLTPSEPIA